MNNILIFTILFVAVLISGCATKGIDMGQKHQLEIKKDDSNRGKLRNIKVIKQKDRVMVTGLVAKQSRRQIFDGHVHVDVYDRFNTIQQSIDSEYQFRRMGLRKAKTARFHIALAAEPEDHGRIVVTHHDVDTPKNAEPPRAIPDTPPESSGVLIIE